MRGVHVVNERHYNYYSAFVGGIKSLGTELSSNQGRFSPIKILDPGRKRFYRRRECDYPL